MILISNNVIIPDNEVSISAIHAQGAGGQNVNKVSSAIHLRFDILSSSLPDFYKNKLLNCKNKRINKKGIIVIKAQTYRTQEKNKADAIQRLASFIKSVAVIRKRRKVTKPTRSSQAKRMDSKTKRGRSKLLRGKISY